jgi:hypothetical protein
VARGMGVSLMQDASRLVLSLAGSCISEICNLRSRIAALSPKFPRIRPLPVFDPLESVICDLESPTSGPSSREFVSCLFLIL